MSLSLSYSPPFVSSRKPSKLSRTIFFGFVAALLQWAACFLYAMAMLGIRLHDPVREPWQSYEFWKFAISNCFVTPLVFTGLFYASRPGNIMRLLHTVVCLLCLAWGVYHMVTMIIDLNRCDAFDGTIPENPSCINRDYPLKTNADLSFLFAFISLGVNIGVTLYWLVGFAPSIQAAKSGKVRAVQAFAPEEEVFEGSQIGSAFDGDIDNHHLVKYNEHVASAIEQALNDELQEQVNGNRNVVNPENGMMLNKAASHIITQALCNSSKSRADGKNGIPTYYEYLSNTNVANVIDSVDAYYHGIRYASKFPHNQ